MLCGVWQAVLHKGKAWLPEACLCLILFVCLLLRRDVFQVANAWPVLKMQHGPMNRHGRMDHSTLMLPGATGAGAVQTLFNATEAWMQCLQDSTMPDILANICNSITITNPPANSSKFCQGFVYDDARNVAVFKPQPASGLLDTNNLCSSPTTHTWLCTQG